jgi:predicted TIM-barrel fold metal-dependent hydrolase
VTARVIFDAHVHVVSPDRARYPLAPSGVGSEWFRESPLAAEDFARAMAANGVERAALVQAVGAYSWDNRYAADAAAADPQHFVGICAVDLFGSDPRAELDRWCGVRGMAGVRVFCISPDGRARIDSPAATSLLEAARANRWAAVATLLPDQLDGLRRQLARFRDLPIALDHCGFPEVTPALFDGGAPLFELARFEALHLKVSTHLLHSLGSRDAQHRFVRALAKHFGARRLLWGSDYPQTQGIDYAGMVALAREAFSVLPESEREWPLGATARSLYPPRAAAR